MRKTICSVLLLVMLCVAVPGQASGGEPRLLAALDARSGDVLNSIYKLGLAVEAAYRPGQDAFAIRVCSADPLPVALALAKGDPFQTTLKLSKAGIPKSSMYYLRQGKNCPLARDDAALTEYWLVPRDAELPAFAEARRASSVSGYQLTRADYLLPEELFEVTPTELERLTPRSYAAVLERVAGLLREGKSGVVVIQVPYYRRSPTPELLRRVRETRAYLKGRKVADHRIYVKRIYAGDRITSAEDTPRYPDITVVNEN